MFSDIYKLIRVCYLSELNLVVVDPLGSLGTGILAEDDGNFSRP